jgi:hypothetical protein
VELFLAEVARATSADVPGVVRSLAPGYTLLLRAAASDRYGRLRLR